MDKHQKKQIKRYIAFGALVALVALLTAMPLLAGQQAEEDGPQASILTAAAQQRNIDTQIIGGGQLGSESSQDITIPEAVKLTKYLVSNGDIVKEGDAIARVDPVSVMLALSEVQETLDYLSEEIADAADHQESDRINAQTTGTVKILYGKVGDNVRDVMLEHGALAVLSLDDKMAVEIECSTDLTYGNTVKVTPSNGKQVNGFVESNITGSLIVTIPDKDYEVGESVTVSTKDGTELGSGELYIHNPWNAGAYYGTIKRVNIKVGDTVSAGKALFQLEVGDHSAAFQILVQQRQEYEELIQELFQMRKTGVLTAPCDGFITGVNKDGTFLLATNSEEKSWYFQPLSHNTSNSGWAVMPLSQMNGDISIPDVSIPDESIPDESIPDESIPNESIPDESIPDESIPSAPPASDTVYYKVTKVEATGVTLVKLNTTEESLYAGTTYADGSAIAVGDIVTLAADGTIQKVSENSGGAPGIPMPDMGDLSGLLGGMAGGFGGFGGYSSVPAFEPYSLETITVACVTSQDQMTLEISVDEQDIAKLYMGQEATITVEALTGQTFPAVITSISNTGTNSGGSSKFTVKLTLSQSGDMLPGMNASAYLPLQSRSVTAIPVAALVEDGAKTIVYTGYDEKKETLVNPVAVTTGVSDGEYVEILSGLSEGDTIYYAYYDTLEYSKIPERGLGF